MFKIAERVFRRGEFGRGISASVAIAVIFFGTVALVSAVYGAAPNKAPDFLFSEDNQITQPIRPYADSVNPKTSVRDNQWLNEPLTRLDYVLIRTQSIMAVELTDVIRGYIRDYFEPSGVAGAPGVELGANYDEKKGRLVLGASVDTVGTPKKPMKQFCERLISLIESRFPLDVSGSGFAWQNNALGLLRRDARDNYQGIVQKLADSEMITASVSGSDRKNNFYMVSCTKQDAKGDITFEKHSAFPSTDR